MPPLLRRSRSRMTPLESTLINAYRRELTPEGQVILDRQIASTNRIHRLTDSKEVCFYRMKWGKPTFKPDDAFPLTGDEVRLASIEYTVPTTGAKMSADLWLVRGFLFSITFNRSPSDHANLDHIDVARITVLADAMQQAVKSPHSTGEVHVSGWLSNWDRKYGLLGLSHPLSPAERDDRLANLGVGLPQEYMDLVSQTEGLQLPGCVVLGIKGIRPVVLCDATYFILAELEDRGCVVVREGDTSATVFLADYSDDAPMPSGAPFRESIEAVIEKSGT